MENASVKYKPKFARVIVEREVNQKVGSIILPDAKKHAPCTGKIVALGETAGITTSYDDDGNDIILKTLKIGDKVIFGRHSGAWLDASYSSNGQQNDDGKYFICQDQDILAVVEE